MHDGYIGYFAKPLGKRQIDQAFPVVRAIIPDLAVERWRAFASTRITDSDSVAPAEAPDPTGIMTVQNEHGYIHGLFSYTVEEHLRHGRVLAADNFIALDLFDVESAAHALLQAMDRVARGLGCAAIHTNLPENYTALPDYCTSLLGYFRGQGHAVETLRLCKTLDRTNDNAAARPEPDTDTESES